MRQTIIFELKFASRVEGGHHCLWETKLKLISRRIVCSIWSCTYVSWTYLASEGVSGGVLMMWDKKVVEII